MARPQPETVVPAPARGARTTATRAAPGGPGHEAGPSLPCQGPGPLPAAPTPLGERAFRVPRRPDDAPVAVRRDFLFALGSVADAMGIIVGPVVYAWIESWLSEIPDGRFPSSRRAIRVMMRFRLLGPLEVRAGDDWRGIGAPKWRSVLAALLIHPGQIVSADTLINEVWRDAPPAGPATSSASTCSGCAASWTPRTAPCWSPAPRATSSGWPREDTDALLFEALVRDGRRAFADGDPQGAARQLTEALALWHGRPLADVPPTPLVEAEAERLTELRLGADRTADHGRTRLRRP